MALPRIGVAEPITAVGFASKVYTLSVKWLESWRRVVAYEFSPAFQGRVIGAITIVRRVATTEKRRVFLGFIASLRDACTVGGLDPGLERPG